jgi:hypothetical protein
MVLRFIRERARYNPLIAGERREHLRMTDTAMTDTAIEEAAEDPRNGGGSS